MSFLVLQRSTYKTIPYQVGDKDIGRPSQQSSDGVANEDERDCGVSNVNADGISDTFVSGSRTFRVADLFLISLKYFVPTSNTKFRQ